MWGLTSQLMGMSTHNTLFDPNRAMVEGGELYGMWGNFNDGGLFATVGFYHPTGTQTAGSFVQGNLSGMTGTSGTLNTSSIDVAPRLAYYFPESHDIYTEIGVSGQHEHIDLSSSFPRIDSHEPSAIPEMAAFE